MMKIAKTDREKVPLFVTLTFPDELHNLAVSDEKKVVIAKKYLKRFEMRFSRHFGTAAYIWRQEGELRKSGLHVGEWFPHYHLLVWGLDQVDLLPWVGRAWWESCGEMSIDHLKAGTKVERIRSWRGVMSYVSKYMTKVSQNREIAAGRLWGVVQAENLPLAKAIFAVIDEKQAVILIRAMRRFAHLRGRDYKSLTIFCDADFWLSRLDKLLTI